VEERLERRTAEETRRILEGLDREYPEADCTLEYKEPFRLLVSAILAAQCTDERVNLVGKTLFVDYPDVRSFAEADIGRLEQAVRSCGFYHVKAKSIKSSAARILLEHGGEVPQTMEELLALPGVGRKIANLVLGDCFGTPGIVVDTHAARLSRLIGLSDATTPERIEADLRRIVPEERWTDFGHLLVAHGRKYCIARRPKCASCPLQPMCDHGRAGTTTSSIAPAPGDSAR
jgi:endonuclease-3